MLPLDSVCLLIFGGRPWALQRLSGLIAPHGRRPAWRPCQLGNTGSGTRDTGHTGPGLSAVSIRDLGWLIFQHGTWAVRCVNMGPGLSGVSTWDLGCPVCQHGSWAVRCVNMGAGLSGVSTWNLGCLVCQYGTWLSTVQCVNTGPKLSGASSRDLTCSPITD